MAGQWYRWNGTAWVSPGRVSLSAIVDRSTLVAGTYIPGPTTTGPLPGTTFTNAEADGSGVVSINSGWLSARGITLGGNGKYNVEGYRFWGEVRFNTPRVQLNNCQLHGSAPPNSTEQLIKNYGSGYYHAVLENCLLDPMPWYTERGHTLMTDATYQRRVGVGGGDVELRWCEVKNVEDGWGLVQNDDLASDAGNPRPDGQRFWVCDRSWIHSGTYANGPAYATTEAPGSGGYPHSDAFQFNTGRNGHMIGSMIGGVRNPAAYDSWPATWGPGLSDDYANATIMLQQEAGNFSVGDPRRIDNTILEKNFFAGGNATLNIVYKNSNTLSGVTIRDNKFFQRQPGWGVVWEDGVQESQAGGYGRIIAMGGTPTSAIAPVWTGNTVYETGASLALATT